MPIDVKGNLPGLNIRGPDLVIAYSSAEVRWWPWAINGFWQERSRKMKKISMKWQMLGVLLFPRILCPGWSEQIQASMSKFSVLWLLSKFRVAACNFFGVKDHHHPPVKFAEYSSLCHEPVNYRATSPRRCHRHQITNFIMKYILQLIRSIYGITPYIDARLPKNQTANQPDCAIILNIYVPIVLQGSSLNIHWLNWLMYSSTVLSMAPPTSCHLQPANENPFL